MEKFFNSEIITGIKLGGGGGGGGTLKLSRLFLE